MTTSPFALVQQKWPALVSGTYRCQEHEAAIACRTALAALATGLRDDPDLRMDLLTDIAGVDRMGLPGSEASRFEVVYQFYSTVHNHRLCLKVPVPESDPGIDSLAFLWRSADWMEREVFDQYGIRFLGHPNLRRVLNHHEFQGHPLRKDYPIKQRQALSENDSLEEEMRQHLLGLKLERQPEWMALNLGPSHPASHGTLRTLVLVDGEKIRAAVAEIGYLHRGFEKSCECHTYTQCITYTDRLNYCSSILNNIGFAKAVERMLGIEIPERAKFLRVITGELSRIIDHFTCLCPNLVDLGALTNFWYLFNPRERTYLLFEKLCGHRLTTFYTRVGGLMRDVGPDFGGEVRALLAAYRAAVKDVTALVKKNRIFLDRTVGVCPFSPAQAISYGFTGPCLRASGVPYDVRKAEPYYHYDEFSFDVPVGTTGDIYDRLLVRVEEIDQSIRIIEQALDRLPGGPVTVADKGIALPAKPPLEKAVSGNTIHASIEDLIHHFKWVLDGIHPPAGELYDATEAANGELGFYLVSDGSPIPHRVRCRPPCFPIFSAYPEMIEGSYIADAVANLGSLNIIAGELDR